MGDDDSHRNSRNEWFKTKRSRNNLIFRYELNNWCWQQITKNVFPSLFSHYFLIYILNVNVIGIVAAVVRDFSLQCKNEMFFKTHQTKEIDSVWLVRGEGHRSNGIDCTVAKYKYKYGTCIILRTTITDETCMKTVYVCCANKRKKLFINSSATYVQAQLIDYGSISKGVCAVMIYYWRFKKR